MDYEQFKVALNHDASFALAGMLGFDSFKIIGNKIRFYCSKMPNVKQVKTTIDVNGPVYQATNNIHSNTERLSPPIYSFSRSSDKLLDELKNMPSLYDYRGKTINHQTEVITYTPSPLVPVDLILPADFRNTSIKEIYECLKVFFKNLLEKLKSSEPININMLNFKRLHDATMCFFKTNKNIELESGLIEPLQFALDGIYKSRDEINFGAIKSLQFFNKNQNSPEAQLVKLIYLNSARMFNNAQFDNIVHDSNYFKWVLKCLTKYIDEQYVKSNGGGYVMEEIFRKIKK